MCDGQTSHPSSFVPHPSPASGRALFLDRDGTINVNYGYVYEPSKFDFLPGVFEFCARAQELGYRLIVVSNQSGVSRGYYTEAQMDACNDYMCAEFAKRGIRIDDVFCCTALDDAHPDRKPNPGMFLKAIAKHGIDPAASVAIGDSKRDAEAAIAAGVGTVMNAVPRVSVLLPVYDTPEAVLREAVDSVLAQTFGDFELLIYNDSPDSAALDAVVKSYGDLRVRLVSRTSSSPLGIAEAHNLLLAQARGEYVALQDHDDVSLPGRLAKQVAFMDAHPEVGLSSCWCERFGDPRKAGVVRYPSTDRDIREQFVYSIPILHPAMIARRALFAGHDVRWDPGFISCNDAKLYLDLMPITKFANLPEVLYRYRMSAKQTSAARRGEIAAEIGRFNMLLHERGLLADPAHPDRGRWKMRLKRFARRFL